MFNGEPGVLTTSKIYINEPSAFARKALIYAPFSGHYHCAAPYQVHRRDWDYLLFLRIDQGQLKLTYLDQTLTLTAGCLYLIDCRLPQHYWAETAVDFRWIHLAGDNSQLFYEALISREATGLDLYEQIGVSECFDTLLDSLKGHKHNELAVHLQATQLLSAMLDVISQASQTENDAVQKVHQRIEQDYLQDLKLEQLAQSVNLSVCHLARQYRRLYGLPAHDHLLGLRIAHAKKMLLTTTFSIEQIADACGFNSTSHFIRAFGQRVGTTPGQFRRHKF